MTTPVASHWLLDPDIDFLNHGSFGACPREVLDAQRRLRDDIEREPVRFLARELEGHIDGARQALGRFVGADPDDLAFVTNATQGVSTVLRSLDLEPGDELVITDHAYGATRNALDFVARGRGARVVTVAVPFPIESPDQVTAAVLGAVGDRTRLAVLDHVTSPTGLVFPLEALVPALRERGVETLVDGAHAPGMLALAVARLGAAWYTGNCHKWMCSPRGAAFLHTRRDLQPRTHPLSLSHGLAIPRHDRSRYRLEFDWTGTTDPTAWLAVPESIAVMERIAGSWEALRRHNRELALSARREICAALAIPVPAPDVMIGSLASVPLPPAHRAPEPPLFLDELHVELMKQHRIEVPVMSWPAPPRRLLRVSAQIYNHIDQYRRLAAILEKGCAGAGSG